MMSTSRPHTVDELAENYTYTQRLIEITGITVFMVLSVHAAARAWVLAEYHSLPIAATLLALAFISSLLFADLASGIVHWAADNWGNPDWPLLGSGFIRPFRHHHVDPLALAQHGFVELNGNNCIVSLGLFFVPFLFVDLASPAAFFTYCFTLGVAWWVFLTNQFHAWAHVDSPPRFIAGLQRLGLVLSKPHHNVHHVAPHDTHYCITTGWMNYPLKWFRVFEGIEFIMTAVTGVKPVHATGEYNVAPSAESTPPRKAAA